MQTVMGFTERTTLSFRLGDDWDGKTYHDFHHKVTLMLASAGSKVGPEVRRSISEREIRAEVPARVVKALLGKGTSCKHCTSLGIIIVSRES